MRDVDEAVVCELLRRSIGSVELLDCSSLLPGLIRRPGLSSWQVMDNKVFVPLSQDIIDGKSAFIHSIHSIHPYIHPSIIRRHAPYLIPAYSETQTQTDTPFTRSHSLFLSSDLLHLSFLVYNQDNNNLATNTDGARMAVWV